MNLGFIAVLLVLYVIPISLGILILYWILKEIGHARAAIFARKSLFSLLLAGFVGVVVYHWIETHHWTKFQLDNQYDVKVSMHEIDAFMDWPIDFKITIRDIEENNKMVVRSNTNGPYCQFLMSEDGLIWIRSGDADTYSHWTVDMKNQKINDNPPKNQDDFTLHAQLLGTSGVDTTGFQQEVGSKSILEVGR